MKKNLFVVLAISLAGCYYHREPLKTGLEGNPLPAFNLLLSDSSTWFNTASIPNDKPIMLFFFNPRCPYCRAETKDIVDQIDKLKDVQIFMITNYPFKSMKNFYNEFQLAKYSNITTGFDTANFVMRYFKVTSVPYTAIYRKDKKLSEVFMGVIYSHQIMISSLK